MLAAARVHLASRDQLDTLTAHFEYPGRTAPGPAVVVVEDVKLGRQVSTLHLTLWQGGLLSASPWIAPAVSRRTVLAYTTHTNQRTFGGISLPTGYEASPLAELAPLPNFGALSTRNADDTWEESTVPASGHFNSIRNWRFYVPRGDPLTPGFIDLWMRRSNGERITQGALPYVVDSFPYNLHMLLAAPELRKLLSTPREKDPRAEEMHQRSEQRANLWFPTVVMNLEVKAALPEEGVEWLALRVTSKQIKDGKFDIDVMVRDVDGEILALSQHVAMILSMERNTAKSSTKAAL